MKRSTGILHIALAALYACAPSLAVVHGIQPSLSAHLDSTIANRHGYRYNGPAHKYLPAASELTTEAVTTTGHWEPNPVQTPAEQQLPYEHSFASRPKPGYNGPYSMQYYEQAPGRDSWQQQEQDARQQQEQDARQQQQQLSTFQYAANHQAGAGAAAGGQRGQAQHLSAGAQHDRRMESGQRGAQLIGQALPERYQRQPFAAPQPDDFVQMQSNSFELPPIYSMHGAWPEQHAQQSHKQQQDFEYSTQGQFYGHAQFEQQQQLQQLLEYPQSSIFQVHVHSPSTQTAYLPPPSREFQAPYY
ncbi:nuclear transcription factor Y subunit beta [Drosophila montana]|uniref:nuclear transcription factor Y subunit beta n=1 Tax=Drosophila montana TaxID=40370 RepID=UPI00313E2F01